MTQETIRDEELEDDLETGGEDEGAQKTPKTDEEKERIKAALAKANKEAQERRLQLKQWQELGVEPDQIKEILQKQKEAEIRKAEERGDYDKLRKQLQEQYEERVRQAKGENEKMRKRLEEHLVDNAAMTAISKLDGVPKILLPHVKRNVRVIEEGDNFMVQVVDDEGSPKINSEGNFMTIEDYVAELKNDPEFGMCFRAPRQSGGGSRSDAAAKGSGGKLTKKKRSEMSIREKIDYITEHGQEAFEKLPV